jgi:hypothetical protein
MHSILSLAACALAVNAVPQAETSASITTQSTSHAASTKSSTRTASANTSGTTTDGTPIGVATSVPSLTVPLDQPIPSQAALAPHQDWCPSEIFCAGQVRPCIFIGTSAGYPASRILGFSGHKNPRFPRLRVRVRAWAAAFWPENPAKNPAVPAHSGNLSAAIPAHSRIAKRLQRAVFTV